MRLTFEWDPDKATANATKHGVPFEDAMSAFGDTLSITIPDPDHSDGEVRYLLLGLSRTGVLLVVSHTERGDVIRIISARRAGRLEKRRYEEGQD